MEKSLDKPSSLQQFRIVEARKASPRDLPVSIFLFSAQIVWPISFICYIIYRLTLPSRYTRQKRFHGHCTNYLGPKRRGGISTLRTITRRVRYEGFQGFRKRRRWSNRDAKVHRSRFTISRLPFYQSGLAYAVLNHNLYRLLQPWSRLPTSMIQTAVVAPTLLICDAINQWPVTFLVTLCWLLFTDDWFTINVSIETLIYDFSRDSPFDLSENLFSVICTAYK